MTRTVYIDLSAKLENWRDDSVIAMTDGGETVMIVSAKVKRKARDWLRIRYPRRRGTFHAYILLAILIYLIAEPEIHTIDRIVIDEDYPGQGPANKIKNELIPLLRQRRPNFAGQRVSFQQVKGSRADRLAREVYKQRRRIGRQITLVEIQQVLK